MQNARSEFLDHILDKPQLKCASISYIDEDTYDLVGKAILNPNYTDKEYDAFLTALDFEYDSGYGTQYVYGTIWFEGNTWSDRFEYDGSEYWDYHKCPEFK